MSTVSSTPSSDTSSGSIPGPRSGLTGSVDAFDAEVGLGTVTAEDGSRYRFHCTAIVDGSRDIPVGCAVGFDVAAAGPGHWEARGVTPRD